MLAALVERIEVDPLRAPCACTTASTSEARPVERSRRVEDAVPYATRHDFLSRLANGGVPMHVVRKIAGHSSISITAKYYTHVEVDALRAAVERV